MVSLVPFPLVVFFLYIKIYFIKHRSYLHGNIDVDLSFSNQVLSSKSGTLMDAAGKREVENRPLALTVTYLGSLVRYRDFIPRVARCSLVSIEGACCQGWAQLRRCSTSTPQWQRGLWGTW